MKTCFVIQPFDGGKFDKRYEDVFKPAISDADLLPYRVDHDPSATIPIDEIFNGIRNSSICLADISLDNPNVWFELGTTIAMIKPVVMVCSAEREKFPFDVQHRSIIKYRTESLSDFNALRQQITLRLSALLEKEAELQKIASTPTLANVSGLSQYEMTALAIIAGELDSPDDDVSVYTVKQKMEKNGFTSLASNLALRNLQNKEIVEVRRGTHEENYSYTGYSILTKGWTWIDENESKFKLTKFDSEDDNIPF